MVGDGSQLVFAFDSKDYHRRVVFISLDVPSGGLDAGVTGLDNLLGVRKVFADKDVNILVFNLQHD